LNVIPLIVVLRGKMLEFGNESIYPLVAKGVTGRNVYELISYYQKKVVNPFF